MKTCVLLIKVVTLNKDLSTTLEPLTHEVDFWNLWMSLKARVPGLKCLAFFTFFSLVIVLRVFGVFPMFNGLSSPLSAFYLTEDFVQAIL